MSGGKIGAPGLFQPLSDVIMLGTSEGLTCLDVDSAVSHLMIKPRHLFRSCENFIDPIPMVYLVQADRTRTRESQNFCEALEANTTQPTPANTKPKQSWFKQEKPCDRREEHLLFKTKLSRWKGV